MATHVIDFETYYDKEYSLTKLQMDEYILDSRFEILLVGLDKKWFSGTHTEIANFIRINTNPAEDTFIAHNAPFDGFILTQVLGIRPARWIDTVSLARAARPYLKYYSLGKLAEHFKLPAKKGYILGNLIGRRRASLGYNELAELADYCLHDIWLTKEICLELLHQFPPHELDLIDMTVRMFTEPRIALDPEVLAKCYWAEVGLKQELMNKITLDKTSLMSNPKFAEALQRLNVDPPRKVSPRTGANTFAFAKTDKEFTALLEHENPEVQALVAARLGVKSTIAETRALCMYNTAKRGKGLFPIALKYWGAKTTGRYSGTNKINAQNIPARGRGSELRQAMVAPPGKMIVVGDSASIELRVTMACAKQSAAIRKLESGVDLYCDFASLVYNRPITEADKEERFLGKVAMLSLQYGVGANKFRDTVRLLMKKEITEKEAYDIVDLYRNTYKDIIKLWHHCGGVVLTAIYNKDTPVPVDRHEWFWTTEHGFQHGVGPGIVYNGLHRDDEGNWCYDNGFSIAKLYGGKVVENLSQHMARNVVMWQTSAINKFYPVSLSVHDEVVCVVDEADVDDCMQVMYKYLRLAPSWCQGFLPLDAKVQVGRSYSEAK